MLLFRSTLVVFLVFFLAACMPVPQVFRFETPQVALEQAVQDVIHEPFIAYGQEFPRDWWTIFDDPQLSDYIKTLEEQNPTLQYAEAKISFAMAKAMQARSLLFPTLILGGDASRQKFSETALIQFDKYEAPGTTGVNQALRAQTGGVGGTPVYFTQYETEFNLNYDFDFWGKNRNVLAAAIGEVNAQIADLAFTRLTLGIELARAYYRLQIDLERRKIINALVQNQSRIVGFTQELEKQHLGDLIGVLNAETELDGIKQTLLEVEADIIVQETLLKSLLSGSFEEEIADIEVVQRPLPVIPVPQDLSVSLIAARPDVSAQLWLIQSAGRQIDIARAGFYPNFSLNALFGFQTIHLQDFFKWPSSFYNVDPAFTLPIFDGGRLMANLRGSEVNYNLAILRYNELVINAVREALQSLKILTVDNAKLEVAIQTEERQNTLLALTEERFQNHLDAEPDLLRCEKKLLWIQDQKCLLLGNNIQSMLALVKALGGGYHSCIAED